MVDKVEYYALEGFYVYAGPYKRKHHAVSFCKKNLNKRSGKITTCFRHSNGKKVKLHFNAGWVAEVGYRKINGKMQITIIDIVHENQKGTAGEKGK